MKPFLCRLGIHRWRTRGWQVYNPKLAKVLDLDGEFVRCDCCTRCGAKRFVTVNELPKVPIYDAA